MAHCNKNQFMKKSFHKFVRSFDQFGHPLTLKYKGRQTYKSFLGGLVTIIVVSFILVYFFVMIKESVRFEKFTVITSLQKQNLAKGENELILNKDIFDIAYKAFYIGSDQEISENLDEYFYFAFERVKYEIITDETEIRLSGNTYKWEAEKIGTETCNKERFLGDYEKAQILGITGLYECMKP